MLTKRDTDLFLKNLGGDLKTKKKRYQNKNQQKMNPTISPHITNSPTSPTTFIQEKVIGKIKYFQAKLLGKGDDTKVYEGEYDGRPVAVKRISYEESDKQKALNEINMLLNCDQHENVVKYFAKKVVDNEYIFIALELCQFSLEDWVLKPPTAAKRIRKPAILEQVTRGLQYLHKLNIIHRDLKPQNILLCTLSNGDVRVKISDFGISKKLPFGRTSQTLHTSSGTIGWMAPEVLQFRLNSNEVAKMTRQTDIFSLGCVFYFVLSNGKHPFGTNQIEIPNNVLINNQFIYLSDIQQKYWGSVRLIQQMVSDNPRHRPQASVVLSHHLFWSKKKALQFCVDISNLIDYKTVLPQSLNHCVMTMEKHYSIHTFLFWALRTSPIVGEYLLNNPYKRYNFHLTVDLVRVIRNMQNHFVTGLPDAVKRELGALPDKFMDYWLKRFPYLVDLLWSSFPTLRKKTEYGLKDYYWQDCDFQFRKLSPQERHVFEDELSRIN